MKKKEKYLYFDTTVRNPLRLKHFLKIANQHNGKILTNDLCVEIIKDLIKNKIFKPEQSLKALNNDYLTSKFKTTSSEEVTEKEAKDLVSIWAPTNVQAGFRGSKSDPSWAPRFFKLFEDCRTFGLIFFVAPGKNSRNTKNEDLHAEKFFITKLGLKLINSIDNSDDPKEPTSSAEEEIVWTHIIAKFQSNNPFSRRLQSMSPFPLFMKVLLELKNIKDIKQKIYVREIPIFLLWPNNDWEGLISFILKFRKELSHKGNINRYVIEEYILEEIGATKSWTDDKSLDSARDKFYRLLGASGLFERSVWTISISPSRKSLVEYIANKFLNTKDALADDDLAYFNYVSTIDSKILSFERKQTTLDSNQLEAVSEVLSNKEVLAELISASTAKRSHLPQLKDIKAFIRYEYFCALLIHKNYKNTKVIANTKTDSFGWPIGHASGSRGTGADIECFEKEFTCIVEPSLDTSGAGQIRELYSITRHRDKVIEKNNVDDVKIFFVSPRIHKDMHKYAAATAILEKKSVVSNLTSNELINEIAAHNSMSEIFQNRKDVNTI